MPQPVPGSFDVLHPVVSVLTLCAGSRDNGDGSWTIERIASSTSVRSVPSTVQAHLHVAVTQGEGPIDPITVLLLPPDGTVLQLGLLNPPPDGTTMPGRTIHHSNPVSLPIPAFGLYHLLAAIPSGAIVGRTMLVVTPAHVTGPGH